MKLLINILLLENQVQIQCGEPKIHKDWPEILRKTEKEAYPGLTYSAKHPNKMCVPCCFINPPEDYDEEKRNTTIFKPYGYRKCNYNPDTGVGKDTKNK